MGKLDYLKPFGLGSKGKVSLDYLKPFGLGSKGKVSLDYLKPFGLGAKKGKSLTKALSELKNAKSSKVAKRVMGALTPSIGHHYARMVESLVKKYKEKKSKK